MKKVLIGIIGICLIVISIFLFVLINLNKNDYIMILKGKKEITITLNQKYKEPGYYIITFKNNQDYSMLITNNVNINKIGEYKVIYEINNIKKIRIVKVVDNTPPEIMIIGKNPAYLCPDMEYVEEGIIVSDDSNEDLNDKVNSKIEKNLIKYEVFDSSNNRGYNERKIIYEDKIAPEITFKKGDNITIAINNKFKDDYKAADNCDGDITDKVKVKGELDTSKLGAYKLVYEITDKAGNTISKTKTVKVVNKVKNVIYLTFDDGPSPDITPKILDILNNYGILATFFVNDHGNELDYIIKRAFDEGHTIANHTASHNYGKIYKNDEAFLKDLEKMETKIIKITGTSSKIMRFPGGSSNTVSMHYNKGIMSRLVKKVEKEGYIYQDWNVSSGDAAIKNKDKVCKNVTRSLGTGANVVLFHDSYERTGSLEALTCILDYAIEKGFVFEELTKDSYVSHHGVAN